MLKELKNQHKSIRCYKIFLILFGFLNFFSYISTNILKVMPKEQTATEYCEEKFPQTTQEFKKILDEMYDTF